MKKKLRFIALLSVGALLLTGCQTKETDQIIAAKAEKYSKNDLYKTLAVDGMVESTDKNSEITTELINYKVKAVNYKVGDYVNAGDVVCELDTAELEKDIADLENIISNSDKLSDYQLQQYQKALENAKKSGNMQLSQAKKDIDDAKAEYERQKNEYNNKIDFYNNLNAAANENKYLSESCGDQEQAKMYMEQYQQNITAASEAMAQYEAAYSAMLTAESTISSCENIYNSTKLSVDSSIEEAQYKIDTYSLSENSSYENDKKLSDLKKSLENSKIKAAKSGIVSAVAAEVGKNCTTGAVMSTQSASDTCVHIKIKEEDLLSVKNGMKAIVTTNATGDKEFDGEVYKILDIKSPDGFDGYVSVDDSDDFRIGMTAKVKLVVVDEKDVPSVNNIAIYKNDDDETCVLEAVKQADNTYIATETVVSVDIKTQKYSSVSSESLDDGDIILLTPSKYKNGEVLNEVQVEESVETGEADGTTK